MNGEKMGRAKNTPIAWMIVHPSGEQVIAMNEVVESILQREGMTTIDAGAVGMVYRALDVKPLFA